MIKKILLGRVIGCGLLLTVSAAYLPRSADTKLVNLMIGNIEQLVISKGDRAAAVAVETLNERLERETSERKKYILGAVIDRLRLTYDIDLDTTTGDAVVDVEEVDTPAIADNQKLPTADSPDVVVPDRPVVQPATTVTAGGKHDLGKTNYYQPSRPVAAPVQKTPPTPARMTITLHVPAGSCDDFHPVYRQIPRDKLYLRRTLEELVNGPVRGESFYPLVVAPGAIQDVKLVDGVAVVNFSSALTDALDLTVCDGQDVLDMFNYTILGVAGVQSVVYAVDGEVSAFYDSLNVLPMYGVSLTDVQRFVDSALK